MELTVVALGCLFIGLMSGMFILWKICFPSFYNSFYESAEEIYKLYKEKRENCPAYLIKRAKSISAEKSPNNTGSSENDIVSENENSLSVDSDKVFQNCKNEFHKIEKCVHNYCCCDCNHTLIECCEVDKGAIIQVINKVITRK